MCRRPHWAGNEIIIILLLYYYIIIINVLLFLWSLFCLFYFTLHEYELLFIILSQVSILNL